MRVPRPISVPRRMSVSVMDRAPWWVLLMMVLPWAPAVAQDARGLVQDGRGVACGPAFDGERAPARDLYCIELTAPPGIRGVSGVVELSPLPSPFVAGVTRDGRLAYQPRITLSGLPAPSTLGAFSTFVAWAADPRMYPILKLGEVGNGTWSLLPIDLNKFVILISAERSADVEDREGRLVLRAQSASARMQPADVLEFLLGTGRGMPEDALGAGAASPAGEGGGRGRSSLVHAADAGRPLDAPRGDGAPTRRGSVSAHRSRSGVAPRGTTQGSARVARRRHASP